jgi:hypothetical protein
MMGTPAVLTTIILAGALHAAPYSCGPFLLQPGPDRMTVAVDHETPVAATLTYRQADGNGAREVVRHHRPRRHHDFPLENLDPDTQYAYEITTGRKHASGERRFRTLPEAPTKYRVIAFGDVRSQPDVWHRLSQSIFKNEPDALFLIGTGDYPDDGRQYQQWVDQFFAPGRGLLAGMPIWPAIGNHEKTRARGTNSRKEESRFFRLFDLPGNESWYRVDYQYLTLLIIDSNSQMKPESVQYRWLQDQLRSDRNRFTVVTFHHPPLTSGPHGALRADGTPREQPIAQARKFLVPLFETYGVELVLNGHDHLYERSYKDGVYYVITGGGGAPLYKINRVENPFQQVAESAYHYVALDIESSKITITAIGADGRTIDRAEIPASAVAIGEPP